MSFLQNPKARGGGSGFSVTSVNGKTGIVSLAKSDVGLDSLTNDVQVKRSELAVAGGVATLNANGGNETRMANISVNYIIKY